MGSVNRRCSPGLRRIPLQSDHGVTSLVEMEEPAPAPVVKHSWPDVLVCQNTFFKKYQPDDDKHPGLFFEYEGMKMEGGVPMSDGHLYGLYRQYCLKQDKELKKAHLFLISPYEAGKYLQIMEFQYQACFEDFLNVEPATKAGSLPTQHSNQLSVDNREWFLENREQSLTEHCRQLLTPHQQIQQFHEKRQNAMKEMLEKTDMDGVLAAFNVFPGLLDLPSEHLGTVQAIQGLYPEYGRGARPMKLAGSHAK